MSYIDFASGAIAGLFASALTISYKHFRKRPDRLIPIEARQCRTLEQEALARAFATLYKRYADETFPHFVLSQDRELLTSIIGDFLRERRDKLGEMYLGPIVFQVGENDLTKKTVDRAIELFLQI